MDYILNNNLRGYELVSEVIVSSATTSVSLTGLNFGKTDDLLLSCSLIGNSGGGAVRLFVNGNTTTTNYYSQYVYAGGTSVSGARSNSPDYTYQGNTYDGIANVNIKLTNNGYFTFQSKTLLQYDYPSVLELVDRFGSSIFTATSITSLTITASVSNNLAVGSRFQLYKRVAPIIADITVSTATTSVDITGLSIDKGSEYMLVSDLVNSTGAGTQINLYANGNYTSTNYYNQGLYAVNTSVSSARDNYSSIGVVDANKKGMTIAKIKLTNNGYFVFQSNAINIYGASTIEAQSRYGTSTFTATSITSLRIQASSNAIGIGSRFQLIKLK